MPTGKSHSLPHSPSRFRRCSPTTCRQRSPLKAGRHPIMRCALEKVSNRSHSTLRVDRFPNHTSRRIVRIAFSLAALRSPFRPIRHKQTSRPYLSFWPYLFMMFRAPKPPYKFLTVARRRHRRTVVDKCEQRLSHRKRNQ